MTEAELIDRYNTERPMFKAWGDFVTSTIINDLGEKIGVDALKQFLRLPVIPRVKEVGSFVNKAFYGKKTYSDPYNQITDKVGVRFVVLLPREIEIIREIICACKSWKFSEDRNFEKERLENPMVFTYQSVHYVITAAADLEHDGVKIVADTPCEIQIRTILQHAYSELTHDTIYKPQVITSPNIHRTIAKSMALIETTDGFFHTVDEEISRLATKDKSVFSSLSTLYKKHVGVAASLDKINDLVIDSFRDFVIDEKEIDALLVEKPFIIKKIQARRDTKHLFRQAVIILIYFCAIKHSRQTLSKWPLTIEELRPIYIDLGLSVDA